MDRNWEDIFLCFPFGWKTSGKTVRPEDRPCPSGAGSCTHKELASQVSRDFSDITKKLATACFYGGTSYGGQIECMRNGIDILVETSDRIKDHLPVSLSILISSGCIGEGNGNPLQCSCLENPRVRGAWGAAIYGVAQSQKWLKWLSSSRV